MNTTIITAIYDFLLDTVAPPDPEVRRIERMVPAAFIAEALSTPRLPDQDGVISLFPYRSPIMRTALIEIKERPNKRVARLLGGILASTLREELSERALWGGFDRPLVIPIPITRRKARERGWNQCELVLEGVARSRASRTRSDGEPADASEVWELRRDILVKTRETADQVGKSREERFDNLRDTFAVRDPRAVAGRNVIVFDDIVTTGATLGEARRALEAAGARQVLCVAIAH